MGVTDELSAHDAVFEALKSLIHKNHAEDMGKNLNGKDEDEDKLEGGIEGEEENKSGDPSMVKEEYQAGVQTEAEREQGNEMVGNKS